MDLDVASQVKGQIGVGDLILNVVLKVENRLNEGFTIHGFGYVGGDGQIKAREINEWLTVSV
ncbi:MAG: hypothetical protein CME13_03795 [Gemmatimonadetes bacterium]|nr:hypothetical protein [Gemmatimonadota bacterium]